MAYLGCNFDMVRFKKMTIETYGVGKRLRAAARLCASLSGEHIILLPVPTTKDGKHITATEILLYDTLSGVDEKTHIFGYGLPEEYKKRAEEPGAKVIDLALDEDFLIENAKITAAGALGYILTSTETAPSELSVGVFGYGRIGSALVRLLLFLGAHVRVYTSRKEVRMELARCQIDSEDVGACNFSGLDLLINTAPTDMRSYFPLGVLPLGLRVIELASGDNFHGIEGIENLPALPERMFPESAGKAYFAAVKRALL